MRTLFAAPIFAALASGCGVAEAPPPSNPYYPQGSTGSANCGNGTLETGEPCDGANLNGQTCASLGAGSGTLACLPGCRAYDFRNCDSSCVPDCRDRVCGPDPRCGVVCGVCTTGTCSAGQCVTGCEPACGERECGPDPVCGVSCGGCSEGFCNQLGFCETTCTPACGERECGPDPICGVSCGTCTTGECNAYGFCEMPCTPDCSGLECGPDPICGVSCGTCNEGTCNAGVCECVPDCGVRVCGPDPVCGVSCGQCTEGVCNEYGFCEISCTPDCAGRECGPDPVCGVSCGTCVVGACNNDGVCELPCSPDCYERECGPDPICGESCGTCAEGICNIDGVCEVPCEPDCTDRWCGPDPVCGVSCGTCTTGTCDANGLCVVNDNPDLAVVLTWNNEADLDLHLRRGDGPFCSNESCDYTNCSANTTGTPPEWDDVPGRTEGDPVLDIDDTDGLGPEQAHIDAPANDDYTVAVNFYAGATPPADSTATVRVYIGGGLQHTISHTLVPGDMWEAVTIVWQDGVGVVLPVDDITANWTCDGPATPCTGDSDCSDAPWPDAEYCSTSGECVRGCRNDLACPDTTVCNGAHTCVPDDGSLGGWLDPCTASEDCQAELYCNPLFGHCSEWCPPPSHACATSDCCPISGAQYCVDLMGMGLWGYCSDDPIGF